MTPYYEHAGITIYHGDCRDVLPMLDSVGVLSTDPPYNVGKAYGVTDDAKSALDYAAWCRRVFIACRAKARVLAVTPGIGNIAVWCGIAAPDWMLAWLKPGATRRSPVGLNNWEPVLVWGCGNAAPTPDQRPWMTDVITAPIVYDTALRAHPCPKPERLARGIIARLAEAEDTILDPFMGTGTTLAAAKRLGHPAIGIEIEERYCEIAVKRLAQEALPLEVA